MRRYLRLAIVTAAVLLYLQRPLSRIRSPRTQRVPGDTPAYACPTCHGLEAGEASPTVAADTARARTAATRPAPTSARPATPCTAPLRPACCFPSRPSLPPATRATTAPAAAASTASSRAAPARLPSIGGHAIGKSTDGKITVPGGDPERWVARACVLGRERRPDLHRLPRSARCEDRCSLRRRPQALTATIRAHRSRPTDSCATSRRRLRPRSLYTARTGARLPQGQHRAVA